MIKKSRQELKKAQSELQVEWQGYEDAKDIPAPIVAELKAYDQSLPDWS